MKYNVIGIAYATVLAEVEADSPEEAEEKADLPLPSVCSQCSRKIEIGDIDCVRVEEVGGDVVLEDGGPPWKGLPKWLEKVRKRVETDDSKSVHEDRKDLLDLVDELYRKIR